MTERTLTTIPPLSLLLALRRKPLPLRVRTLTPEDLRLASGPVLDRLPRCCVSSHDPIDTACRSYLEGMNGRCCYCDHEAKCHPGPGATCDIGRDYESQLAEDLEAESRERMHGICALPLDRWHETVSYPEVKGAK